MSQFSKNMENKYYTPQLNNVLKKLLPIVISTLTLFNAKAYAVCSANDKQYKETEEILGVNKDTIAYDKSEFEDFSILWHFNQIILILDNGDNSFVTQHTPFSDIHQKIKIQNTNAKLMKQLGCLQYADGTVDTISIRNEWEQKLSIETRETEKIKFLYQLAILYSQDSYEVSDKEEKGKYKIKQLNGSSSDIASFYTYANQLRDIINSNPEYTQKYQIILQTLKMFEVRLLGDSYNSLINGNPISADDTHRQYSPMLHKAETEGLPIIKTWLQESKSALKKTNSKDTLNGYVMRMEPFFEGFKSAYFRLNTDPRYNPAVPSYYPMADDVLGIMHDIFDMYQTRADDTEERNYVRLLELFLELLPDHMEATINGFGKSTQLGWAVAFAPTAKAYLLAHFNDDEKGGRYKIHDQVYQSVVDYATTTKSAQVEKWSSKLGQFSFAHMVYDKMVASLASNNWHELEKAIEGSNATGLIGSKHDFDKKLSETFPSKLGIHAVILSQSTPVKEYRATYGREVWVSKREYEISGALPWHGSMVLRFNLTANRWDAYGLKDQPVVLRPGQTVPKFRVTVEEVRDHQADLLNFDANSEYEMKNVQATGN